MKLPMLDRFCLRLHVADETRYMRAFANALPPPEFCRVDLQCKRMEAQNLMQLHRIIPMLEHHERRARGYRRATDERVLQTPGVEHYRSEVRHAYRDSK